jgi:hypothetical protein
MGAPLRESNGSKPSKNEPSKDALKEGGAAPSSKTTQAPEPPWKRKARRGVFEGDVAAVELRSQLALAPDRIPEPAIPISTVSKFGAVLRLTGVILIGAALAGVTGYLLGFRQSTKSSQPAFASDQADNPPALSTPAANLKALNSDADPPAVRTAAIGVAPVAAPAAATRAASVDAAQRAAPLATGARTALPSSAARPREDASEIAAKMKIGADLMAHGDIAAARMMFQRAAEAGEAAGAFALAETYDPAVLGKLRLRGGIAPDLELARSWYEKARDLGSIAAPDRIVRLTQLPQ